MPPAEEDAPISTSEETAAAGGGDRVHGVDDEEHDSKERFLHKYFLQEWNLIKSILDDIVSTGTVSDFSSVYKIRSILDKYQEQGQLLEPYLESIVSPLMLVIRSKATKVGSQSDEILLVLNPISIIIYTLVTVCGYKAVVKFLPHQASDLELAVSLLEKCHNANAVTSIRQESTGEMEAKCVTLLWLSILVLIPFDIRSVDTSVSQSNNGEEENEDGTPPLVKRVLGFCKDYLSSAGPMRSITSLLLSRFLTRPDMMKALTSFIHWTQEVLSSSSDNSADHFQLLGAVEALAAIFKAGSQNILLDMVPVVWNGASTLMKSNTASRSPLLCKYLVKLSQRIGLTCLPRRPPSWCYKGRVTSLPENISSDSSKWTGKSNCSFPANLNEEGTFLYEQEEDIDIPETVEEIIEVLLSGLKDKDTVVRWSAAKGIGRITSRLTYSLSDEVLSSVMELFSLHEGDGSWHGGCLALAELARRGLLLPISLPKVVPIVAKALHYDVRRGPHSIGAHVRDAAAYVCWAFGRAYYHLDMRAILEQLAPHLLTVACYDREVNCRRAASAAFQENVGRQGNYPHGIEIVNIADYFALSSRVNSYLHVAVLVAVYEGYLYPFVDELISSKICHWDKGLRELAGKSLSSLVKYNPKYFSDVLDKVIPCTLSSDLFMRHGATLAAGELVLALHQCGCALTTDKQNRVAGVVQAIEKTRLYRGKGGEIMRSAVSRFIQCISSAHIPLSEKIKRNLLDTLEENLRHPNSQIQNAAVDALKHFVRAYLQPSSDEGGCTIVPKYLEQLSDSNVAVRRGSALALGSLPYKFLIRFWKDVLLKLSASCAVKDNPEDRDAEAQVNAIKGLVSVCEILTDSRDESGDVNGVENEMLLFQFIKDVVMQSLLDALYDYSVDNRGDVGSWVREAAMDGLEICTYILCARDAKNSQIMLEENHVVTVHLFHSEIATKLVGGIVKQAVEKMDKLREAAAMVLHRILYNQNIFVPFIPYREKLEEIISINEQQNWSEPTFSFLRFVQLLDVSCYRRYVLSGLVIAVGGLQEFLRKASLFALLDYLQESTQPKAVDLTKLESRELIISRELIWILQQYRKCDRVIIPTLRTIEILFGKQIFLNMESDTEVFCRGVLSSIAIELRGSKDFSKLYAGISILGYIASVMDPVGSEAFLDLLDFLTHRFPKIRKAAAEQVYLVLLQNGDLLPEDCTEKALEIVAETCWDGDISESKQKKLELCELAGLDPGPLIKKNAGIVANESVDQRPTSADENASYYSLVGSSGF